ncbi:uncharacterized protein LOC142615561 [Castanea sativa]|uniref:uncharacterized protein LOC142615561 n=1 Tax=Castanea sativa TaxID=21020 RepID=UPI003F64B5A8
MICCQDTQAFFRIKYYHTTTTISTIISSKITGKFLRTYKHLHILFFEVLANLCGAWRVRFLRLRGQCLFTLDDAFFPAAHRGKRFFNCVWVRLLSMGPRDHMQERSYLTRSLCYPWGERKILRVWVRLLSIRPRVCILEKTISCQLLMGGSPDRSMW